MNKKMLISTVALAMALLSSVAGAGTSAHAATVSAPESKSFKICVRWITLPGSHRRICVRWRTIVIPDLVLEVPVRPQPDPGPLHEIRPDIVKPVVIHQEVSVPRGR